MGYYTIEIFLESRKFTTIVIELGKFGYNRVPMGLCAYGEVLQTKVDELLIDIKGFKTYIDDILVLGKGSFSPHIYQLIVIFARLHNTVITVNGSKRSFLLK